MRQSQCYHHNNIIRILPIIIIGNKKSSSKEEHHLLQLASEHYSQSLRRRGVKGLVYNVVEQRRLRQRAEHHFHKRVMTKYFTKVMLKELPVFSVRNDCY